MGVVWSATNTNTLRRVALKVLKGDGASDLRVRRRFLREARAASAVQHPNVVEILDVVELDDGSPAMVMELLEGESLGHRLRERGRLDLGEAAAVMLPALSAVGAAHALGIVHRDLKPDNIFLARQADGTPTVKVLDFGIAKVSALDHDAGQTEMVTGTGTILGTPYYMSPEQVFADAVIDYRSDIWAFGVILYQCLTGVRPTQAENVGQIMKIIMTGAIVPIETTQPSLPPELTQLVGRMLSSAREARPQSLKEVCDVLRAHSDVRFPAFGEPVFVNVGLRDLGSGSGEVVAQPSAAASPETLADPALANEVVTRSERRPRDGGTRAPEPVTAADVSQTQSTRGITLGTHRPPASTRWLKYALVLALVGLGGVAALELRPRPTATEAPRAPSANASSAPSRARVGEDTSRKAASAPAPVASDLPTEPAASASSVAPLASSPAAPGGARSAVRPAVRKTDVHPTPAPARASSEQPAPTTPGGLVEKPPF
jgi:serine/threonine protein kinase